jgi:hypothetical protein
MREGVLEIEVDIRCMVDYIVAQAKVPVKEVKYGINGDVLVIEIAPDVESILNSVLNR